VCLVAPTGAGKTVMASDLILRAVDKRRRTIFLAPRSELVTQCYNGRNIDKISNELARLNGMPAKLLYTDEEMEGIDAQAAEQAELQQILQAAPVAASAAKDIAQASALAGASPNEVIPGPLPA
jgi:reverse gyrase